jgi:hypothetical protein
MDVLEYIKELADKGRRGLRMDELDDIRQDCVVELLNGECSPLKRHNLPLRRESIGTAWFEIPEHLFEEFTDFLKRVIDTGRKRMTRHRKRMRPETATSLAGRDADHSALDLREGFDMSQRYAKQLGQFEEDVILVTAQVHPMYHSFAELSQSHQDWSRSKCYQKRRELFDQLKHQLGPAWDNRHDNC